MFNGADGWESGGYNQHHGWILWAMAEHYRYTGDKAWLERNAAKLIKACRWISHERARTKNLDGPARHRTRLAPARFARRHRRLALLAVEQHV